MIYPNLQVIDLILIYLRFAGPSRPWAIANHLAEYGRDVAPEIVGVIAANYKRSFLCHRDYLGPLVGLKTKQFAAEVEESQVVRRFKE